MKYRDTDEKQTMSEALNLWGCGSAYDLRVCVRVCESVYARLCKRDENIDDSTFTRNHIRTQQW